MPAWTTTADVVAALGPSAAPPVDDDWLVAAVGAANAAAYRKRAAAGYTDPADPDAPAPSDDVAYGTTLWAVALWRERGSTDGFSSYTELDTFTPTGGSWGQIKRLLGIGRAQVDTALVDLTNPSPAVLRVLRRRGWVR